LSGARTGAVSLLAVLASAALAQDPAPGRITEKIVCRQKPDQAYALFLPSGYTAQRPSPILYLLDARGRALLALERFRSAAETYRWILASSYNSRSDTQDDPNTPALQAMWNDTHARFAIDPRRVYLGGFSGGARAAFALAFRAPKSIAGVVGCGAGLPDDALPLANLPFLYYGTSGTRDFNYYEMRALDERLAKAGAPHRVAFFDGGHDWPPAPAAGRAVAWMEIGAMKAGTGPHDEALAAKLFAADLAAADALSSSGRLAEASVAYANAAEDYLGLSDVGPAAKKAAELSASPDVRQSLRDAARRDDRDRAALQRLSQKVRAAARDPEIPAAAALSAELGIPALKHRAATGDPEEKLSAERLLANLRVETSFYLPEELAGRGDAAHARLMLAVAAQIDPDDPGIDYNLASVDARSGQKARARRDLERAVEKGFRRFDRLEEDPDFAALRADPDFRSWLAATRERFAALAPEGRPTP
jgi:predicted esterase